MLFLPFPSPDTVTIATQVFQSCRSVRRGTDGANFLEGVGGSEAWECCLWWLFFPMGRSSFCDNSSCQLALQLSSETSCGFGICFVCNPKVQHQYKCICIWYICVCTISISILYNVAFSPLFCVCVCVYSPHRTKCHPLCCAETWSPGPVISDKIKFWLISIFKTKWECWLSWKPLPFQHQHLGDFPLFLTVSDL